MTLLELCEPLFQYVCRLNRSARKGGTHDLARTRGEILGLLEDMKAKAAPDPRLADQYREIELVLLFFVDFMVKESQLSFAGDWSELAWERNELAGDEKLWDLLDQTLADPGEAATERLTVFYTCIGLGFTGWYTGQPEYLRQKMLEISARIRQTMELDENARICPEAYENVDTSDLVQPPGGKLIGIAVALIGMILVLVVGNLYLFKWASRDLTSALDTINQREQTALQAEPVTSE